MLKTIRSLFKLAPAEQVEQARVPDGSRFYVIGDIHGRLDLLDALIDAIERDDAARPKADTTIIFLGDLVDRGPDSAGVIERAMAWGKTRTVRLIAGNHEEMFLDSFDDRTLLRHFLRHGGRETILSYGLSRARYNKMTVEELQAEMRQIVPAAHREFLASFEDLIVAGDYAFVHAGIHPERGIEDQKPEDLRWIRERFLKHTDAFSHVIVHGHTIFEEVELATHRIGIDTGAFRTGKLTALVLEGTERRFLQAREIDGAIAVS